MSLHYTKEIFDRATGEIITLDQGQWMTLTEFTALMGVPMRLGRAILMEIGLVEIEGGRIRLKREFEQRGYGRRLKTKRARFPFDALSPVGQKYARERWGAAAAKVMAERSAEADVVAARDALDCFSRMHKVDMTTQMSVCWLLDHFPNLSNRKIARVLDVTEAIVHKWVAKRNRQLATVSASKVATLE